MSAGWAPPCIRLWLGKAESVANCSRCCLGNSPPPSADQRLLSDNSTPAPPAASPPDPTPAGPPSATTGWFSTTSTSPPACQRRWGSCTAARSCPACCTTHRWAPAAQGEEVTRLRTTLFHCGPQVLHLGCSRWRPAPALTSLLWCSLCRGITAWCRRRQCSGPRSAPRCRPCRC